MKMPWESIIESTINAGGKLLDDAFHTDAEKAEEKRELLKMQWQQLMQQNAAQLEAYVADAKSGKNGWRHTTAQILNFSIGYAWLVQPLLSWVASVWGVEPPPAIPIEGQVTMLMGMLGLGGIRAHDLRFGSRV